MRVLYVAKHGSGGNDDEGAIAHALSVLGHEVIKASENQAGLTFCPPDADLCLFHKWDDVGTLKKIRYPKVFWWFDRVTTGDNDPHVSARNRVRLSWMDRVLPHVDLGLLSDGDFVEERRKDFPVRVLRQGADERVIGEGDGRLSNHVRMNPSARLLFPGQVRKCGLIRETWVAQLQARYGSEFQVVQTGVHQYALRNLIAGRAVVLCPDYPVSHRYWSNRVYLAAGFNAFIIHPYCSDLLREYFDGENVCYYKTRAEMYDLIDYYLGNPEERKVIADLAFERTREKFLYRHRVQTLVSYLQETGLVKRN